MMSTAAIHPFLRQSVLSCLLTLSWLSQPLTAAEPAGRLIPQGKFPARVHVVEDYETDIERRWWMAGTPETKDVPPGSKRACRAGLTHDFDRKLGDPSKQYKAVVFNPVPGPPMGPNTRLSFRYKLLGTSEMRVQIYSLSNNYHRRLTLADLPQGVWSHGTVDMTQLRRPDGGGGPLAVDERIDDIQFYIDPAADLLIDDIVLYDAAAEDEQRPFPKRIIFTGWFDTGKQGQEWPGEFEIVLHEKPRIWDFARSIERPDGACRLAVSLRGRRRLSSTIELSYLYRLERSDEYQVELRGEDEAISFVGDIRESTKPDATGWAAAKHRFTLAAGSESKEVDEIRFRVPLGGTLEIDDLLLYEP
jgi:hypothetical protein